MGGGAHAGKVIVKGHISYDTFVSAVALMMLLQTLICCFICERGFG